MKVWFLVLALAAVCLAEPPAPRYLPPSNQYGAPSEVQDYMSPPSAEYGAPSNEYGAPSSQYGAPSSQYGAPSSQYGAPSSQYGAPSAQYGAPSTQYGAPSAHSGAASRGNGFRSNGFRSNGLRSKAAGSSSQSSIRFGSSGRKSARPSARYGLPSASATPLHTAAFFPAPQQNGAAARYQAPSAAGHGFAGAARHSPAPVYGAPAPVYGPPGSNGGYAYGRGGDDDLSEPASYQFQYEVKDDQEGAEFGHQEEREGDDTKGEYRVLLPDGRTQVVTYTADARGFNPEVKFEEPKGGYGRGPAGQQGGYY